MNREKGAVLVEMALMLPILMVLFLIALDMGIAIREYQILQNASREGARFSSLPANWISPANPSANLITIQQYVVDYMQRANITIGVGDVTLDQNYAINVNVGGASLTARGSEVLVTYTRDFLLPGIPFIPSPQLTLAGRAVFLNLY